MKYNKRALKINEIFDFDVTNAIVENAIEMCFSNERGYISGIKEFAIRANIMVFMSNVDLQHDLPFKELYAQVLYGNLWNDFIEVNKMYIKEIKTLIDIVSDAIDKSFYIMISGG
jgi:hypothetical protein